MMQKKQQKNWLILQITSEDSVSHENMQISSVIYMRTSSSLIAQCVPTGEKLHCSVFWKVLMGWHASLFFKQ